MMPIMGGGMFSAEMGGVKAVMAAFMGHLIYGAILGVTVGTLTTASKVAA